MNLVDFLYLLLMFMNGVCFGLAALCLAFGYRDKDFSQILIGFVIAEIVRRTPKA